jgi:hypothetical protein
VLPQLGEARVGRLGPNVQRLTLVHASAEREHLFGGSLGALGGVVTQAAYVELISGRVYAPADVRAYDVAVGALLHPAQRKCPYDSVSGTQFEPSFLRQRIERRNERGE